ncbi:MAG: helix-turn-helix domain-containing protein [Pseudomonadota bacterium]
MDSLSLMTVLLAGFAFAAATILLIGYWLFFPELRKTRAGKIWCTAMMAGLCVLQAFHVAYFVYQIDPLSYRSYGWTLLLMPIFFFFFSRSALFLDARHGSKDLLHFGFVIVGLWLPSELLPLFAFFVGAGYTLWFVAVVSRLRRHVSRFRFEFFFFSFFACIAVAALFMVAALQFVPSYWYFVLYANAISCAFFLIVTALLIFPELVQDVSQIVEATYSKTTLGGVNIAAARQRLDDLMVFEKSFQDESLSLKNLADKMELSSHQLSELINTEFGFGFPRLIRQHRVRSAKGLLLSEPNSSILSISMETGFKSQSAFYAAFKEEEGISPGQFRQDNLGAS